jgi:HSP20 family molecular chaperone IbpA
MTSRDPIGWMLADACQMLADAERLQRRFFRLDFPRGARVAWEPPVDVYADDDGFVVVVALPGVSPGHAEVICDGRTLLIRAQRRLTLRDHPLAIERLEIPHGYFERRLTLPVALALEIGDHQWRDGCLILHLKKGSS